MCFFVALDWIVEIGNCLEQNNSFIVIWKVVLNCHMFEMYSVLKQSMLESLKSDILCRWACPLLLNSNFSTSSHKPFYKPPLGLVNDWQHFKFTGNFSFCVEVIYNHVRTVGSSERSSPSCDRDLLRFPLNSVTSKESSACVAVPVAMAMWWHSIVPGWKHAVSRDYYALAPVA